MIRRGVVFFFVVISVTDCGSQREKSSNTSSQVSGANAVQKTLAEIATSSCIGNGRVSVIGDGSDCCSGIVDGAGTCGPANVFQQPSFLSANGVWLTHDFLAFEPYYNQSTVSMTAGRLLQKHMVSVLMPNGGAFGSTGTLTAPQPHLNDFLANLTTWEKAADHRDTVYLWVSAVTTGSNAVDLTNSTVRSSIASECTKVVTSEVQGSYIVAGGRPFDGVMLDFEPSGEATTFENYVLLISDIRTAFDAAGVQASIGVAGQQLATPKSSGVWQWTDEQYATMASNADRIEVMAYGTWLQTAAEYQAWLQAQVSGILTDVSSGWTAVGFSLPAYPASPPAAPAHNTSAENVTTGAHALQGVVSELLSEQNPALDSLVGASIYLHTDGTGTDGYAGWSTDWKAFDDYWLGGW